MSIRYELAEFFDNTLDRSEDFGFQVADQTRRALCGLWQNLPGALIPNPADSFRRGAISALCQDFPPPPPPVPQFSGGQCPCSVYRVNFFRVIAATGQRTDIRTQGFFGPIQGLVASQADGITRLEVQHAVCANGQVTGTTRTLVSSSGNLSNYGIVSIELASGSNNCGNPAPEFPGRDIVYEGDTINEGDTIVEGDRPVTVDIDLSPTFEDDVCIGQFVFCADVEGNRVTLDAGGITINLPGTGGGDSGGGGGGDSETITNIDNRTTIIQENQEECCAAIQLAISQFRNRVTELFNESELRDACIVGLIRNNTLKIPKFEEPISERASGFSGLHGITRFIQPLRGDSCFLVVNVEPTETFRGRLYTLREENIDVEGGFGHVEVCFFDGGERPAAEAGIRVVSSTRTIIRFDTITSGNQIRLSLKGGLNYSVVDPGFRWRPSGLPQCDELVDPTP